MNTRCILLLLRLTEYAVAVLEGRYGVIEKFWENPCVHVGRG